MKIFIETERLIIREILPTDIDGMFELDADPEVHRYLWNKPSTTKAQILDTINYIRQQYQDHGIGRWAIIDKKTNEFMGWTGLKFVTDTVNGQQNFYDLGYRLIRRYWGQGIASESALASRDYAFNVLNVNTLYASANCDNKASNAILQKVGMQFIETFYYDGMLCNWYKLDKNNI